MARDYQLIPWYQWPLVLVVLPFAIPMFLLALLSIPFAFVIVGIQSIGERRFRRQMEKQGRFVSWDDLTPTLNDGSGTLIIEQMNQRPFRIWWTPDDVSSLAPCSPPDAENLQEDAICPPTTPHPFVSWCHHVYAHEQTGTALLTLPSLELPPGLFHASFFKEHFPRVSAIDTVYC